MEEKKEFRDFELSADILAGIEAMGFEEPTRIQSMTIPVMMKGKDIIGQSHTGTGKTAAFGIPILQKINTKSNSMQALIICPTRELAIQISEEMQNIAKQLKFLTILPVYGGQPIDRQIRALRRGVHLVIGTPGRIIDHIKRRTLVLDSVNTVVLDEADEMLDMGFIDDIKEILAQCPDSRQTVLFSATMPSAIVNISRSFQRNPEHIMVEHKHLSVPAIEQNYYELQNTKMKLEITTRVIDYYNPKLTLIFCNTKRMVDELVSHLQARGYSAEGLHGDMNQNQRDSVMGKFRKETFDVLVATDVAARGIDVDNIEVVINYDISQDEEYYIHRIGRTGRAGRSGKAFTFVVGREVYKIRDIQRYTGAVINRLSIPLLKDIEEIRTNQMIEEITRSIKEGHLGKYVGIVEKMLSGEFTTIDIAAALLKMRVDEINSNKNSISDEEIIRQNSNAGGYEKKKPVKWVKPNNGSGNSGSRKKFYGRRSGK